MTPTQRHHVMTLIDLLCQRLFAADAPGVGMSTEDHALLATIIKMTDVPPLVMQQAILQRVLNDRLRQAEQFLDHYKLRIPEIDARSAIHAQTARASVGREIYTAVHSYLVGIDETWNESRYPDLLCDIASLKGFTRTPS